MKFLVDAQLPYQLSNAIQKAGFDTIHTDELPNMERTSDDEIRQLSIQQNRIVITKDSDFIHSHLLLKIPPQILYISTGNISNKDLAILFQANFQAIVKYFETYNFIELAHIGLVLHNN